MLKFKKITLLMILLAVLTGCLRPLHKIDSSNDSLASSLPPIALNQVPKSEDEWVFKSELEKIFQNGNDYNLRWSYNKSLQGRVTNKDDDYSTYTSKYTVLWQLYKGNIKLDSGKTNANINLNIYRTGYPTAAAQQQADRDAAKILAKNVERQILLTFAKYPNNGK